MSGVVGDNAGPGAGNSAHGAASLGQDRRHLEPGRPGEGLNWGCHRVPETPCVRRGGLSLGQNPARRAQRGKGGHVMPCHAKVRSGRTSRSRSPRGGRCICTLRARSWYTLSRTVLVCHRHWPVRQFRTPSCRRAAQSGCHAMRWGASLVWLRQGSRVRVGEQATGADEKVEKTRCRDADCELRIPQKMSTRPTCRGMRAEDEGDAARSAARAEGKGGLLFSSDWKRRRPEESCSKGCNRRMTRDLAAHGNRRNYALPNPAALPPTRDPWSRICLSTGVNTLDAKTSSRPRKLAASCCQPRSCGNGNYTQHHQHHKSSAGCSRRSPTFSIER